MIILRTNAVFTEGCVRFDHVADRQWHLFQLLLSLEHHGEVLDRPFFVAALVFLLRLQILEEADREVIISSLRCRLWFEWDFEVPPSSTRRRETLPRRGNHRAARRFRFARLISAEEPVV